jgi:energy-coupling factor transporter ATP-binding protein EcfA2
MSAAVDVRGLTVRYPGRREPALIDLSVTVQRGERLGIAGRTGAGKSTLALSLAGFIPRVVHGSIDGRIVVDGIDAVAADPADLLGRIGIVFTSPANQLTGSKPTVREELAFGLENLGVPRSQMDERIDAVMERLGIAHLADREPSSLSGGEGQRVAIGGIVAMGPGILVLDEPTAELDPAGTAAVADLLDDLAATGTTIVCVEHDQRVLEHSGRLVVLEAGHVIADDSPIRAAATADAADAAAARAPDEPLTWMAGAGRRGVSVAIEHVSHRYPNGIEALRDASLEIRSGEALAIAGANGSGKTTLVKLLDGLLRPTTGRVLLDGVLTDGIPINRLAATCGFAFQDPGDQLFERSVEREVSFGPRNLGRSASEVAALVEAALAMAGLTDEREVNPYDLDRSRRKLVTLAGVLAMDPSLVVLDEPTTGQDRDGVRRVGRIVQAMQAAGRTVIAVTHDMAFAAQWFDRTVVMHHGRLVEDAQFVEDAQS